MLFRQFIRSHFANNGQQSDYDIESDGDSVVSSVDETVGVEEEQRR